MAGSSYDGTKSSMSSADRIPKTSLSQSNLPDLAMGKLGRMASARSGGGAGMGAIGYDSSFRVKTGGPSSVKGGKAMSSKSVSSFK